MNDRKRLLKKVEDALRQIFPVFEPAGLLSMYIWGSVVREDFDPAISDLDLIFVLDDSAHSDIQNEIKKQLTSLLPEFKEIGGQGLYLSELRDGPARSFFANLHPFKIRSVLTDFPDWHYVCGRKFSREDFPVTDLSPTEQITMAKEQMFEILNNLSDTRRNWRKDLVKQGLRLGYIRAIKNAQTPLNYDTLASHALPEDRKMIELFAILRKKNDYSSGIFDPSAPLIREWLNSMS